MKKTRLPKGVRNYGYIAGNAFLLHTLGPILAMVFAGAALFGIFSIFSHGWPLGLLIIGLIIGFFWWESRKKKQTTKTFVYKTIDNETLNPCGYEEAKRRIEEWERTQKGS